MEANQAVYILLACNHYTTKEEQEFYSVWAPKGRGKNAKAFCEQCGTWKRHKAPMAESLPDTLTQLILMAEDGA
jgi:hypothetical protein